MRRAMVLMWVAVGAGCVPPPPEQSVTLTEDALLLGGEALGLLKDISRFEYLNVPALEEALRTLETTSPTTNPCGAIYAPPSTRFGVLKRVLYSCATAGLGPVGLRTDASQRPLRFGGEGLVWSLIRAKPTQALLTSSRLTVTTPVGDRADDRWFSADRAVAAAELKRAVAARPGAGLRGAVVVLSVEDEVSLGELLGIAREFTAARAVVSLAPASN